MSKQKILENIRAISDLGNHLLPDIPSFDDQSVDTLSRFQNQLIQNKAEVLLHTAPNPWTEMIKPSIDRAKKVYSQIDKIGNSPEVESINHPSDLEDLDLVILEGNLGVADNGAIWVSGFSPRVIPFITKYLIIVIHRDQIVRNMHQAYDRIDPYGVDFGVFISGPSKTADIEQALVVGAQGALGLTVVII